MPGKLERELAFVPVIGFQLETASRKAVQHMNCNTAALFRAVFIGVVGHKPDILEILGVNIVSGRDFSDGFISTPTITIATTNAAMKNSTEFMNNNTILSVFELQI